MIASFNVVTSNYHRRSMSPSRRQETASPVNQDSLHGHEMIAPSAAAVAHQVAPGAPTHLHSHNNNQFAGQHRQINNNANALSYHQMALPQDSLDSLFVSRPPTSSVRFARLSSRSFRVRKCIGPLTVDPARPL